MNLAIAFGAGILSFFSPCFLPLVPAYLIYITGLSFEELKQVRFKTIAHSLSFILGFTIVFVLLGLTFSALGQWLFDYKDVLRWVGGGLLVLLGLYLLLGIKLSFLEVEKRFNLTGRPAGYFGSVLVGMAFAAGWTPCIGPVLAGILAFASQAESVMTGALMLAAFSLGLGAPLLLLAVSLNFSLALIKKLDRFLPLIHAASGSLLLIVGLLLLWKIL